MEFGKEKEGKPQPNARPIVLLVLEAMKMETAISSPVAGKVAKVRVGVQAGQVPVEFE